VDPTELQFLFRIVSVIGVGPPSPGRRRKGSLLHLVAANIPARFEPEFKERTGAVPRDHFSRITTGKINFAMGSSTESKAPRSGTKEREGSPLIRRSFACLVKTSASCGAPDVDEILPLWS
jgi:hypothetical protein